MPNITMKSLKIITKIVIAFFLFAFWKGILTNFFSLMLPLSFVSFAWLAYKEFKENKFITLVFIIFGAAVLNPIYPFSFNADMQNEIYLVLAIGLLISSLIDLFTPSPEKEED
jgi:hypothetical protein